MDTASNRTRPMALIRIAAPFDHPDWIFELKHDGFRALAYIDRYECQLVSRRPHVYRQFPMLETEMAHAVRATSCIVDGEIVCLAPNGRSHFWSCVLRRTVNASSPEGRDKAPASLNGALRTSRVR